MEVLKERTIGIYTVTLTEEGQERGDTYYRIRLKHWSIVKAKTTNDKKYAIGIFNYYVRIAKKRYANL